MKLLFQPEVVKMASITFTVAWYNKQKVSTSDEEEHIIKTAAGFYPAIENIKTTMNLYPLHYKQLSKNS